MSPGPKDLSPREARDRFLARRKTTSTHRTVRSYENRLTRFVDWCEENGIERIADLTGWDIDEFIAFRQSQDLAPATIKGQIVAVRQLVKYCVRIEAVDKDLLETIEVPNLSAEQESSDVRLASVDATALLAFYRDSPKHYATPEHAFLEVAWNTGARMGGIRALDLQDFDPDDRRLEFRHRPPSTPLKNKEEGERIVGIPETVVEVLETYIARERYEKRDDDGREPLFSCRQGRPSTTTLRAWSYLSTQPCVRIECPHDKEAPTCQYTKRNYASQCPSSRSPHQIRTGSITWQLDQGLSIEMVAKRVNASPEVIRRYYDKATEEEEFEQRRRSFSAALDIENVEDDED